MRILTARFRTNAEFEEHYQEELPHGGLFCPTTKAMEPGETVIVELSVPALPNKVMIRGRVQSWRPALPRLRVRAGAIVQFAPEEATKHLFVRETVEGTRPPPVRRKHARLPVSVPVRYRIAEQTETQETEITEISVGGAMIITPRPLSLGTSVILEITPPGAVQSIPISGKATYHLPNGNTGLKFLYRDAGGSRRLRELVKRLRQE